MKCWDNAGRVLKRWQAEASVIVLAQLSRALPAAAMAVSDAEMLGERTSGVLQANYRL